MTQEQKAKAYDEALERAKSLYDNNQPISGSNVIINNIFPELAESEDERIRKELISFLQLPHPQFVGERKQEEWIAWIEKQGQTFTKKDVDDAYCKGLHDATAFKAKDWYVSKVDGKIHNIHHSIDKDEPKFKEGDWIINNDVYGDVPVKIKEIGNYLYLCERQDGVIIELNKNAVLKEFKHWDITDAKDGDVLANDKSVFIYAKILYNKPYAYCGVDKFGVFKDNCLENNWSNSVDNTHPATKEQRDLLFQKMHEVGYEWDAEKKELRKIEQKSVEWSEEDEKMLNNIDIIFFEENSIPNVTYWKFMKWLKSLKDRVQRQPKQEWSEEDNNKINSIKYLLHELDNHNFDNWLESLKDRGLPKQEWSEEDENAVSVLRHIIKQSEKIDSNIYTKPVKKKLFDWLESLKERIGE